MNVLITGSASGIGLATARKFLLEGHAVVGLDKRESAITDERYTHYICDVSEKETLQIGRAHV